jgi:ubiquinone/menaquinone biosynthesis C-methylase UbiE
MIGVMSITVDIAPLKEVQKFIWSQGDYEQLAGEGQPAADELLAACGVGLGDFVLDVGAGTGNAAVAAARRGARVLATDITPRMVELGRARCEAGGLVVEWHEAGVEALPFASSSFDCVVSCFAAMFAPRPEVAVVRARLDGLVADARVKRCAIVGTAAASWRPRFAC